MHHPEGSPLALCDTCPRSFHLLCMGLEWEELSEGDWSCPRCAERKGLPTKRLTVDEVKNRQSTGGGRCVPPHACVLTHLSVCLSVCLSV